MSVSTNSEAQFSYECILGTPAEYCGLDAIAKFKSAGPVDQEALVNSFRDALSNAGFSCVAERLCVVVSKVLAFRGEALHVPMSDTDQYGRPEGAPSMIVTPEALAVVEPDYVLVEASRSNHSSGDDYDYRYLAVPRGSSLPSRSRWYHEDTFDKEVNRMGRLDTNSETIVDLPEGAQLWDGTKWVPAEKLEYYY